MWYKWAQILESNSLYRYLMEKYIKVCSVNKIEKAKIEQQQFSLLKLQSCVKNSWRSTLDDAFRPKIFFFCKPEKVCSHLVQFECYEYIFFSRKKWEVGNFLFFQLIFEDNPLVFVWIYLKIQGKRKKFWNRRRRSAKIQQRRFRFFKCFSVWKSIP